MSFLFCNPSVCVVGKDYQILVATKEFGTIAVEIDGEFFYEENSGVLSSEKKNFKIIVPSEKLNKAKKYFIHYRKVIERKKYFSVVEDVIKEDFTFKPIEKIDDINAYHIADIHKRFDLAKDTVSYFGDNLDLLLINGDICEVVEEQDFFDVLIFLGEISFGKIPIVFSRGNHDTRGRLAERFTDFFPSENKNTYYDFEIGVVGGVVLDCGEDKVESHIVYADLNRFDLYRKKQTAFLKVHSKADKKYYFALSHIPLCKTTVNIGDEFDIEKETYTTWCSELERIGASFIISGHLHKTFVVEKNDESKTCPCSLPLIVGSAIKRDENFMCGTALNFKDNKVIVKFTDNNKKVHAEYEINI